eukprot:2212772-Rhodomonas_salina.1
MAWARNWRPRIVCPEFSTGDQIAFFATAPESRSTISAAHAWRTSILHVSTERGVSPYCASVQPETAPPSVLEIVYSVHRKRSNSTQTITRHSIPSGLVQDRTWVSSTHGLAFCPRSVSDKLGWRYHNNARHSTKRGVSTTIRSLSTTGRNLPRTLLVPFDCTQSVWLPDLVRERAVEPGYA